MSVSRAESPLRASAADPRLRLEFAQKAFIMDRDRLLMVRKAPSDPFHPGRWEVPGGRLEVCGDADLDDHIRREVWEEVGLRVVPGPPFHLWQWFMPAGNRAWRGRAEGIRVVGAARLCRPVTLEVSLANQTATDHLVEPTWVPLPEIEGYDLIPALRPVMRAFLLMHGELMRLDLMCPADVRTGDLAPEELRAEAVHAEAGPADRTPDFPGRG